MAREFTQMIETASKTGSGSMHPEIGGAVRRKPADTANLAFAVVCVMMLFAAFIFSELDSRPDVSSRMTSAIRGLMGRVVPVVARSDGYGSSAHSGRMILVAENDDRQRLIAKTTLERYGYDVALAENGPDAVAFFRKAERQVALVVLGSGEARRAEIVQRLRAIRPDVRILDSRVVAKPFSAVSLAEAVRKSLGPN
jgi:hypothetical protein